MSLRVSDSEEGTCYVHLVRRAALFGVAALAVACGGRTDLDAFWDASQAPISTAGASDSARDAGANQDGSYAFIGAACAEGGVPVCPAVLDIPAGRFWEGCFYVECQRHGGACRRCTCHEDGGWRCEAVGCPYCAAADDAGGPPQGGDAGQPPQGTDAGRFPPENDAGHAFLPAPSSLDAAL